jgi:hypothetical protein
MLPLVRPRRHEGDARPGPDARKWCVGIALDPVEGKFYWTQKGGDKSVTP